MKFKIGDMVIYTDSHNKEIYGILVYKIPAKVEINHGNDFYSMLIEGKENPEREFGYWKFCGKDLCLICEDCHSEDCPTIRS